MRLLVNHRPHRAPLLVVEISNEPLVMAPGDIKLPNFLIDPWTLQVTIIDFGGISALPRSFVSFTLYSTRDAFIARITEFLGWAWSDNLLAMGGAARRKGASLLRFRASNSEFSSTSHTTTCTTA